MASKKKFEGLEVVSSAPRMSTMEQYLYDERQKPEAQRRQEIMDTAMGFTGAGITGVSSKAAARAGQYIDDFLISNVRRSNGAIGTQGVTEPQIYDVLTHAAGMKLDPSMSMREMVEAFKSSPAAQQKLRDFTKTNPIEVSPLPDGSFHLRDGHHRTFLLNQIGDLTVPAIQSVAKAAGGSVTMPNNYRAGGRVRMI